MFMMREESSWEVATVRLWMHANRVGAWIGMTLTILPLLFPLRAAAGTPDAEVLPPGVAVHRAPDRSLPVVTKLPAGALVEVLITQRGPGGEWAQIMLPSGDTGFVPGQALRRLSAPLQWRSTGSSDSRSSSRNMARPVGEGVLDIPLRRAGGVFLVRAQINGQIEANLVVDTGATFVMISEALADELGLDYANKRKLKTRTPSGFLESPMVVLGSIYVPNENGAGVERVPALVATLPGTPPEIAGLLGQSFLGHFHVTIDAERGVMHLQTMGR